MLEELSPARPGAVNATGPAPGRPERTMRIAILGDGAAERAWFEALRARDGLDVVRATEGETAADVLVLGGPPAARADVLRRATIAGPLVICLHPPGPDDLAYLQASGRVVPDLPMRLHPAVDRLREALADGTLGECRSILYQVTAPEGDLLDAFARSVDVLRALLGEFESVTASGDPEGPEPEYDLMVRLRSRSGRLAELRISRDAEPTARLTAVGSTFPIHDVPGWSPHAALLEALGTPAAPTLEDGVRAMELTRAVRRSLKSRRTVDVRPAPLSAEAAFKSSMATIGCLILLGAVALFAAASAAQALGFESAAKLVYVIPPALAAFLLAAWARKPGASSEAPPPAGKG